MTSLRAGRAIGLAGLVLLALSRLFWKLQSLDTSVNLELTLDPIDLYDSLDPMPWFGFGSRRCSCAARDA